MPSIILTERQLELITDNISKEKKIVNEAWYNTVMDVLGIVDPTPIVDTINSISYFSQGETLFGILTLIAALPMYVGDVATKPVMMALKTGNTATKQLESALKLATKAGASTDDIAKATATLKSMAEKPGFIGQFLQSAESWAPKINTFIDKIPAGPFKGMKNIIKDYFTLLGNAGKKSNTLQKMVKDALKRPSKANLSKKIPTIQKYLKDTKIFNLTDMSKPGFLTNTFFGGLPRLFRSPEGRGIKILMGKTKWWLGFLDYIGIGNFIGPEELSNKLGGDDEMAKKMEEYQKTDEAKKNYKEDVGTTETTQQTTTKTDTTQSSSDPIQNFLSTAFGSTLNKALVLI
jgi:hypothetical protein